MKKFLYFLSICLTFAFVACKKETATPSPSYYYNTAKLNYDSSNGTASRSIAVTYTTITRNSRNGLDFGGCDCCPSVKAEIMRLNNTYGVNFSTPYVLTEVVKHKCD